MRKSSQRASIILLLVMYSWTAEAGQVSGLAGAAAMDALRGSTGRGANVFIIAPSVSTSMEARSIRIENGWVESNLRQANAALVVVRSMLFNPLDFSYDSVKELQDDAENQLNIAGENFHVYLFAIDDNMRVRQLKHVSYKADD